MKVLGLIGSYRKMGNTEVLVKEALIEANRRGAEVSLLRLTDLRIDPCKGCMACAFKFEDCRIPDGWCTFRDKLLESDAVVLGAPTYLLGPAGIIKMLTDRTIAFAGRAIRHSGKPAVVIGISGVRGWDPFSLPMLNVFMLSCGLNVIDQVMLYAQGPGEILLDDWAMERAKRLGSNLFEAASRPVGERTYVGEQGMCPVCHQNLFSVKDGILECALCRVKARFEMVNGVSRLVFDSETVKNHRWSEEGLLEHFSLAVLPSGPRFMSERDEIRKRARKYQPVTEK